MMKEMNTFCQKKTKFPSDFSRKGDNVRAVIETVDFKGSKPQIIVSRTAP